MAYPRTNLDGWDPMAESYHDANINSYEQGPGANLTPYARTPANQEYKLYVNNIPVELSETGIQQLFNRYGQTLNVLSPPGSSWAFVTFGTFREAEAAMRVLNNAPPLNLTVTFAKKKPDDSQKKSTRHGVPSIETVPEPPLMFDNQRREYVGPEQYPVTRPMARNLGRAQEFALLARRAIAPPPEPMYESDDRLYPNIDDPLYYDLYEDADPFADTNAVLTRGRVQISNDGTRFVTMGRGHAWYELPAHHKKVNQQIRAAYESREAGLYEYGVNKFAQQVGKCQYCTKLATMRCQRCQEYYCSRQCQQADWPRHKIECQTMPRLEGGPDSGSLSMSSGDEGALEHGHVTTTPQVPMRRPTRSAGVPTPKTSMPAPVPIASETPVKAPLPPGKENSPPVAPNHFKRHYSGDQKRDFDQNKPGNTGYWNPTKNDNDNQNFRFRNGQGDRPPMRQNYQQNRQESGDTPQQPIKQNYQQSRQEHRNFENRQGQYQNYGGLGQRSQFQQSGGYQNKNSFPKPGGRGNSDQRNQSPIEDQVKNINLNDTEVPKPVRKANDTEIAKAIPKPVDTEIAVAIPKPFDTKKPEPIRARLIEPDVSFHKATEMPKSMYAKSTPKVSFSQPNIDSTAAETSKIQSPAKPVVEDVAKKASESITVKTHVTSPPTAETKIQNVVELLELEEEGFFETHVLLGSNKAAVTIGLLKITKEYTKISSGLTEECDKLPPVKNFKPSIGDLVCGKRLDDWIRGTLTSVGPPMRLAAVDEGRVEPVTAVRPIPSGYDNLPTLGAVFELTEGEFKLASMEQYTFVVEKINPESVCQDGAQIVIFSGDDKEGKGFLKPWTPAPEQKGIPYASLTNGTEVAVITFRSHAFIYVRSLLPADLEVFNRVTQDVALWSTKASPMPFPPVEGEMVIAKYAVDGNYYRAIVRKIVGNKITVSYVDFGNTETTDLESIKPMSQKLKEYPACVARLVLKDVPKDVPMTKEVSDYLAELTEQPKSLMCTFESSPTDGAVLKVIADGTCVNNKINELLTPSWKKKKDDTTVFTLEDMEVAELGPIGQTIHVLALYSYGALMHAMAPQDMELIGHVTGVMAAQMEQYCKETKEHYIPRQNELCLALFEGQWFRAVCMETNTSPTTSTVNYIDFGNIEVVEHTNIKLITKDFTTTKTLASVCSIVGLGPVDEAGELLEPVANRVKELVVPNSPVLVKIVECSKPGEYTIELPEVRDVLVKEGLLKV